MLVLVGDLVSFLLFSFGVFGGTISSGDLSVSDSSLDISGSFSAISVDSLLFVALDAARCVS